MTRVAGLVLATFLVPSLAFADSSFNIRIDAPAAQKTQKAKARIHLTPGPGFHFNKEFPTSVTVVAPAGVTVDKPKQTAKDALKLEEAGADFEVVFTPSEAGSKTFTGELKFAVCSANSCDPKKQPLNFTVDVK
jgi:hypothetical protein